MRTKLKLVSAVGALARAVLLDGRVGPATDANGQDRGDRTGTQERGGGQGGQEPGGGEVCVALTRTGLKTLLGSGRLGGCSVLVVVHLGTSFRR